MEINKQRSTVRSSASEAILEIVIKLGGKGKILDGNEIDDRSL